MSEQPTDTGAVQEVTDVESAAAAIEARMNEEPAQEPEETEVETETEAQAEVDEDAEESDDPEQSDSEEPDEEAEEEQSFSNINELAEALDMTPEEFLKNIKMTRKIDGVEEEVTLEEIREGNQRDADYRRKTMELAEQRRSFETEQGEYRAQLERQLTDLATMANFSESQLDKEYQAVNWQQLREDDPAEYSALLTDFQNRNSQIQQLKQQGSAEYQRLQREAQEQQATLQANYISKQNDLLLDKVPEWSDTSKRSADETQISQFLAENYGFSESDASMFVDHRMTLLARDAMKVRNTANKVEIAKKKVKNLPKVLKPSSKNAVKNSKQKMNQDLKARFKKSGSVDDLASALLSRM